MDIRQMTAFVAVYESGSISGGAQRLGFAQPSVSGLIRDLEGELETRLFERFSRGIEATPAGDIFYRHCQKILAEADAARKAVSGGFDRIVGPVNVGLAPTAAQSLLPKFLASYLDEYPEVELRVSEAFSGPLTEWTLSGEVDFAIVAVPPIDRRLTIKKIAIEPVGLITSAGRATRRREISLAEGPPLKLVLAAPRNGLRTIIDRYILLNEIPVARTVELDSLHGMLEFVRRSGWVTLLPVTSVISELERGSVAFHPIVPHLELGFYLIYPARRVLSAAAARFVERLEAAFAASMEDWLGRKTA